MPDFPIIDSHVHLYDPARLSYPWMADIEKLNRPHLPPDFFALLGGIEVEGLVFVEVDPVPDQALEEARFVAGLAADEPRIMGAVAAVRLDQEEGLEQHLEALRALPLVRGVRHLIQHHVDRPGWVLREAFVAGVQALARHGLSFDLCILHPQLADTIELVRRCPEVAFVLDHIGKPGINAGLKEPWWSEIETLAALPNVVCKISGVVTEADHANWTEAEVAPYIRRTIDCFGYDRVMFGGDWPVSELATSYRRWVDLVDQVVADASPEERRKLYRDNARRFYRL